MCLELQAGMVEFSKVVPNEFHRKFYLRVFKWTVAFATWNMANVYLDNMKTQIVESAADKDSVTESMSYEEEAKSRSPMFSPGNTNNMRGSTGKYFAGLCSFYRINHFFIVWLGSNG